MEAWTRFDQMRLGMLVSLVRRNPAFLSPGDYHLLNALRQKAGEAADTEYDVSAKLVDLVLEEVPSASREEAVAAFKKNNNDVVDAIMELSEKRMEENRLWGMEATRKHLGGFAVIAAHTTDAGRGVPIEKMRAETLVVPHEHAYVQPEVTSEDMDRLEAQVEQDVRHERFERAMIWRSMVDEVHRFQERTTDAEKDAERIAAAHSVLPSVSIDDARSKLPVPERKLPSPFNVYHSLVARLTQEKRKLQQETQRLTTTLDSARGQIAYDERYTESLASQIRALRRQLDEAVGAVPAPIVVIYPAPWPGEPDADDSIPEAERCVVCLGRRAVCAIVDCGHIPHCVTCATGQGSRPIGCPVCRVKVTRVIRLYR